MSVRHAARWMVLVVYALAAGIQAQTADTAVSGANPAATTTEEEFSLDDLDQAPSGTAVADTSAGSKRNRGRPERPHGLRLPFELAFAVDATFEVFAGEQTDITFSSNHEYVIVGVHPSPKFTFAMELVERVYWELRYNFSQRTALKVGKLAIPFGPLFLHQLLGGVVEKPLPNGAGQKLMIPEAWVEYGLLLDRRWVDTYAFGLTSKLWVTNGLQGSVDLPGRTVDFTSSGGEVQDNNIDKGVGLRIESTFLGKIRLNLSGYTCKWAADPDAMPTEEFLLGDRLYIAGVDAELGYTLVPAPFLRDLRVRGQYVMLRTHSTQRTATLDNRVPWHTKDGSFVEVTYQGYRRWFDLRYRFGTYDDNREVRNSRDLLNHNVSVVLRPARGLTIIPTYMWNQERVNETRDNFFFIKAFIEL